MMMLAAQSLPHRLLSPECVRDCSAKRKHTQIRLQPNWSARQSRSVHWRRTSTGLFLIVAGFFITGKGRGWEMVRARGGLKFYLWNTNTQGSEGTRAGKKRPPLPRGRPVGKTSLSIAARKYRK